MTPIQLQNRVTFKQVRLAVLVAFFLGIVMAMLQVTIDWRTEREVLRRSVDQLMNSMQASAAQAAYGLDYELAERVAGGLFEYQPVQRVRIIDDIGMILSERKRLFPHGKYQWAADLAFGDLTHFARELTVRHYDKPVGRLTLDLDSSRIAGSFFDRVGFIVVSGMTRNFLLALILGLFFHRLVTRPLASISKAVMEAEPGSGKSIDIALAKEHENDELGLLDRELKSLFNRFNEVMRQQKQIEKELRQSDEALRESKMIQDEAVRAGKIGFWNWDLRTDNVRYSPEWTRQIGYEPEEIEANFSEWESRVYPADLPRAMEVIEQCLASSSPDFQVEFRFRHKDGGYRWILSQGSVFRDDQGRPLRLISSHVDITERKELEAELLQSQKMESIGTLAGGIAHDFNNILGVILGYTELLKEDARLDPRSAERLDQIIAASQRAKELIGQLLAFSRRTKSTLAPVLLSGLIEDTLKLLKSSLPATIAIQQRIQKEAEGAVVLADQTQIHQVLMNLCMNAYQAMEQNGGVLTVSLQTKPIDEAGLEHQPQDQTSGFVHLVVSDTGSGMPPEIQQNIFDPYFTTKEVGKGTGLGLAIVHGIVNSYGGSIICRSKVGKGTTFMVSLPLSTAHVEAAEAEQDQILPQGNERILFVDDEIMLANMTRAILERLGYAVTATTSSLDALSIFERRPYSFDLVITDQTMPDLTGLELAGLMLRIRPDLPIILCTGYSSAVSPEKIKAMGIKGFAMKPLMKNTFATMVRQALEKV